MNRFSDKTCVAHESDQCVGLIARKLYADFKIISLFISKQLVEIFISC